MQEPCARPASKPTSEEQSKLLDIEVGDDEEKLESQKMHSSPTDAKLPAWLLTFGLVSISLVLGCSRFVVGLALGPQVVINRNVMSAAKLPCLVLVFQVTSCLQVCPVVILVLQNGLTVIINVAMVNMGVLNMHPWKWEEMKKFLVHCNTSVEQHQHATSNTLTCR